MCKDNKKIRDYGLVIKVFCNFVSILLRWFMKRDFKSLIGEIERKLGRKINWQSDWGKLKLIFKKHHLDLNSFSPETKNRIALFAGFQNWKDFQDTLMGEEDGQINYEADETK